MKITKSYLKQVIKEELERMEEAKNIPGGEVFVNKRPSVDVKDPTEVKRLLNDVIEELQPMKKSPDGRIPGVIKSLEDSNKFNDYLSAYNDIGWLKSYVVRQRDLGVDIERDLGVDIKGLVDKMNKILPLLKKNQ